MSNDFVVVGTTPRGKKDSSDPAPNMTGNDVELTELGGAPRGPVPGTVNDESDMRRMGKLQQLNVSTAGR